MNGWIRLIVYLLFNFDCIILYFLLTLYFNILKFCFVSFGLQELQSSKKRDTLNIIKLIVNKFNRKFTSIRSRHCIDSRFIQNRGARMRGPPSQ